MMLKIPKFLNLSRHLLRKFNAVKVKPKLPSIPTSHTRPLILLPAVCWLGINLLSLDLLKIKTMNSIPNSGQIVVSSSVIKYINGLMNEITTAIREGRFDEAKVNLHKAIESSHQNSFYEKLPHLYDLLSSVAILEGNLSEAEEILVRSIEKLAELGYSETDNEIIRFKLLLSRLYQSSGNKEMAGIGFRYCIRSQEMKLKASSNDEVTQMLYLNLMFWYALCLIEDNQLEDAKMYMEKALELTKTSTTIEDAQIVIVLHHLAELCLKLKEFDEAIAYLTRGLRLCYQSPTLNSVLPIFMVKLGLVFLVKKMYDNSEYWCNVARMFAKATNNPHVEDEAILCLTELKKHTRKK